MLRRVVGRGGFWQAVSGAPLPGETDREAAVREVREETGFDVSSSLFSPGVAYRYRLDPARANQTIGGGCMGLACRPSRSRLLPPRSLIDRPCSIPSSTTATPGARSSQPARCSTGRWKPTRSPTAEPRLTDSASGETCSITSSSAASPALPVSTDKRGLAAGNRPPPGRERDELAPPAESRGGSGRPPVPVTA